MEKAPDSEVGLISVDPWLCTGCGACELACLAAHEKRSGTLGIRVLTGPEAGEHSPRLTAACDLCRRTYSGEPSCVAHCPTGCLGRLPGSGHSAPRILYVPRRGGGRQ